MQILTLDFETYYDDVFTLKRMTTEEYVRDARFEALCLGVRMPDGRKMWIPQEHIPAFLAQFDWTKTGVLCHHAQFDGLILSHHYGVRPAMFFDTLAMARCVLGNHVRVGLDSLTKHFGTIPKSVPYGMFKGRHWVNIYPHEREQIGNGAADDCEITFGIFQKLAQQFPAEEFEIVDMTIRMFTEPQVYGDTPLLDSVVIREEERKHTMLNALGVTESDLQSADTFVRLLNDLEVDVEYKPGKKGLIPAIAKTDDFMKSLLEDPDEILSGLAEARLAVKSTLQQTRAGRMADMSRRGALCIYLAPYAAHTLRFGGGDSLNWQNLPRVNPEKPGSGDLRRSVSAPGGGLIVAPDASQIECRIVNWLGKEEDVLDAFRSGRDVYAEAASRFYNKPIDKKSHPLERQLFKQVELGCGYGLGAARFVLYAKSGVGGPPIYLEEHEAQAAIQFYRDTHPGVVQLWRDARRLIPYLAGAGMNYPLPFGPCKIYEGYIEGPNGLRLLYPDLQFDYTYDDGNVFEGWSYMTRNGRTKLYGGKLVENVVQFLARIVVTQAWSRIRKQTGLRPWLSTHDDLAYVVAADVAKDANEYMTNEMRKTPEWAPGIPLDAEGEPAERYVK